MERRTDERISKRTVYEKLIERFWKIKTNYTPTGEKGRRPERMKRTYTLKIIYRTGNNITAYFNNALKAFKALRSYRSEQNDSIIQVYLYKA